MPTNYEVVWCESGVMYIWTFGYHGEDVFPTELPPEVGRVMDFVCGLGNIPVMVYRLAGGTSGMDSYCCHSNARDNQHLFANANDWLNKKGFKATP